MKELSIEEKAKRYDEALEKAKQFHDRDLFAECNGNLVEYIFLELKEREDEKIRKELIRAFKSLNTIKVWNGIERTDILDWLERQNSNVDNANKEYWRGYREGKQEILDKYAELENQGEHKDKVSVTEDLYEHIRNVYCCIEDAMTCENPKDMKDYLNQANYDAKSAFDMIEKQGEPVEINPTDFETRLQYLIGKFDSLPKEELIGSLSFWLNVVQNDGTYKPAEKQGEQKPIIEMKSPEESLGKSSKEYNEIVNELKMSLLGMKKMKSN